MRSKASLHQTFHDFTFAILLFAILVSQIGASTIIPHIQIRFSKTGKVLVGEIFTYTVFSQKGGSMEPMEPPLDPPLI